MEQETDDGVTPVISACQSGNSQQLKELIDQGVSLSQLSFILWINSCMTIAYYLSYQFILIDSCIAHIYWWEMYVTGLNTAV